MVAHLDRLDRDPTGGSPADWRALWRLVTDDPGGAPPATVADCAAAVDRDLGRPGERLVAYGTLRPGEVNHHLLAGLGTWQPAWVRGRLGTWNGYPVLHPADGDGAELAVMLLTSSRLPGVLGDLDAFEGPAYRRAWVVAEVGPRSGPRSGALVARCYVSADPAP